MIINTHNPFGKYNGKESEYVLRALDSENPENGGFPWVTEFEDQTVETWRRAMEVNLTAAFDFSKAKRIASQ